VTLIAFHILFVSKSDICRFLQTQTINSYKIVSDLIGINFALNKNKEIYINFLGI